ncbi:MAG TPA: hypothetical protein VGC87_26460 [Pyrinomonadaceae bacterium]|jgi:tellurite resistance protein TerC
MMMEVLTRRRTCSSDVLVFVGLKMVWLNNLFDGKFSISWSLGIICAVIMASVALSLLRPKPEESAPAEKAR